MVSDEIRDINSDYDCVLKLWQEAGEGIQLRKSDESEEIAKKFKRDLDLFLIYETTDQELMALFRGDLTDAGV